MIDAAPLSLSKVKEVQLHSFWKHHAKAIQNFKTVEGVAVVIIEEGVHNTNQGPDFLHAYLNIGGLHWFGSIEFHIKTSDWFLHKHQHDIHYKPVILHVVWENDSNCYAHSPIIELKSILDISVLREYNFYRNNLKLPCFQQGFSADQFNLYLSTYSIHRLKGRVNIFLEQFELYKDWNQVCWIRLCKILGGVHNGESFGLLAESIPYSMLTLFKFDLLCLKAILLGQSGLLDERDANSDEKVLEIYKRYAKKHGLRSLRLQFIHLRMRPNAMPQARILYLTNLLYAHPQLIDQLAEIRSEKDWSGLLKSKNWQISKGMLQSILINLVLPLCVAKSKLQKTDFHLSDSVRWMSLLAPENNSIVKRFEDMGVSMENAYQSQGLLQLYKQKCEKNSCSGCPRFNGLAN